MKGSMTEKRTSLTWWQPSLIGLNIGALCCAVTFWPSLVPRPWAFQGVLSGFIFALGYGLGLALASLWDFLEMPSFPRQRQRALLILLSCMAALLIGYSFWNAAHWQNVTRTLMGMPEVEESYYLQICTISGFTGLTLLLATKALILSLQWATRLPLRYIRRRIASVAGVLFLMTILVVAANDTLIRGTISAIDTAQAAIDTNDPPGAIMPSEITRSGNAVSLIDWDRLGKAGKLFVHEGPRRSEIESFSSRPAKEPIRAYVGLRSGDSPQDQAVLALRELKRAGAFSRKLLVIATPTGTGWLQNGAIAPLEYLHDGDVATIGVQYSYLPSPLSLILQPGLAHESASTVFDVIYNYWKTLPSETRPKLYLFGLSLGSLGSETSVPLYAYVSDPFHGALWAGPTFRNPLWKRVQRNRNPDSPAWQPQFENGSLFRVFSPESTQLDQHTGWSPIRTIFLANPSDPIVFFEESMWSREPEWLQEPRGGDVSESLRWVPLITFFQVAFDMLSATSVPAGHAHNYAVRDYIEAWATVTSRDDWTPNDTAKLLPLIDDENQ